jgi:hypothetical protein
MSKTSLTKAPKAKKESDRIIFDVLLGVMSLGAIMIVLVSLYNLTSVPTPQFLTVDNKLRMLSAPEVRANHWYSLFTTIGFQFLIAGAAGMSGAFLGFIFGIPKYVSTPNPDPRKTGAIAFSDNLVQVSDWLTKIIVGVGLTQLTKIPGYLYEVGKHISAQSGGVVNSNAAIAIIVYFVICGFAAGYLWTTIYYPPIMNAVHKAVTNDIGEIVKESEIYKDTIQLFNEQISKSVGQSDIDQSVFEEAIRKLNQKSEDAAFQMVDRICYENADNNKKIIKRIIPIFQAFINAGNANRVFEYYAELGFAFMALDEYEKAHYALLKAYQLRPAGLNDYEQIEHNLAESLIAMHTNADMTYSISEELKTTILNYLRTAIKNPRIEEHMKEDSPDNYTIRKWLTSINIKMESLKSS